MYFTNLDPIVIVAIIIVEADGLVELGSTVVDVKLVESVVVLDLNPI